MIKIFNKKSEKQNQNCIAIATNKSIGDNSSFLTSIKIRGIYTLKTLLWNCSDFIEVKGGFRKR